MKNSKAWVISFVRTDNMAINKCNKVVLSILPGRFTRPRVQEFMETLYHVYCRNLIEQKMESKYSKPKIEFYNYNLSYFTSISYGSLTIIAQKSEILEIKQSFLKWRGLDDEEWDYEKMERLPIKCYETEEGVRVNIDPFNISNAPYC